MYDLLMNLPLFKGISRDHLSELLEKTHADFANFKPGSVIYESEENCGLITFLLKGNVEENVFLANDICISQTIGCGALTGSESLFGWSTCRFSSWYAITDVSVLRISKEEYINILLSDKIYLINYLNLLSLRSQRIRSVISTVSDPVKRWITLLLATFTDASASNIQISLHPEALSTLSGIPTDTIITHFRDLNDSNLIQTKDNLILIKDRRKFFN